MLDDEHTHLVAPFVTTGPLENAENPGLYVSELGIIGLPLSNRDAMELSKASHQAPFGKGSETIVDTGIRRTWELDQSQFDFRNPDWSNSVDNVVIRVVKDS